MIERPGIEHHAGGRTGLGVDVNVDVPLGPKFAAVGVDPGKECGAALLEEVLRVFRGRRGSCPRHRDVEGCIPTGVNVGGVGGFVAVFGGVSLKHDADAGCGGRAPVKELPDCVGFGERRDVDRFSREIDGGIAFEVKRIGGTGLRALQGGFKRRGVGRKDGLRGL